MLAQLREGSAGTVRGACVWRERDRKRKGRWGRQKALVWCLARIQAPLQAARRVLWCPGAHEGRLEGTEVANQ